MAAESDFESLRLAAAEAARVYNDSTKAKREAEQAFRDAESASMDAWDRLQEAEHAVLQHIRESVK